MTNFKDLVKGINPASITGKILGLNVDKNERGIYLKFFIRMNGQEVPFRLSRKADNVSEIEAVEKFVKDFQKGDYNIADCEIRIKGESYETQDGSKGEYKESYISVPYLSSLSFLGENYVMTVKKEEFDLLAMENAANEWKK